MRERGFDVWLVRYVDESVTPDNLAIIGHRRADVAGEEAMVNATENTSKLDSGDEAAVTTCQPCAPPED